jgi:hypothetical protein
MLAGGGADPGMAFLWDTQRGFRLLLPVLESLGLFGQLGGSPFGVTGLSSADGRVTIMMPHPERVVRAVQNSWHPDEWVEDAPWRRLFRNARRWLG